MNVPLFFRAMSQLRMAVRAFPKCMRPVGEGAKRTIVVIGASRFVAKAVGDRITPVTAEVSPGDLDSRRRLSSLVFCDIEQVLHPFHHGLVMPALHDLSHGCFVLDQLL